MLDVAEHNLIVQHRTSKELAIQNGIQLTDALRSAGLISLFNRMVDADEAAEAGDGLFVRVPSAITLPSTAIDGDQVVISNATSQQIAITGPIEGQTSATVDGGLTLVFVWSTADGFWEGQLLSVFGSTGPSTILAEVV